MRWPLAELAAGGLGGERAMGGGVSLPRKSSETWSAEEVAALLNSMGYAEYAKAAEKNDLSGMELLK